MAFYGCISNELIMPLQLVTELFLAYSLVLMNKMKRQYRSLKVTVKVLLS